jgi:hypothetical protein
MDQRLTTPEIIAALVRVTAIQIAVDAHRKKLNVSRVAKDHVKLLWRTIAFLEDSIRSTTPRRQEPGFA